MTWEEIIQLLNQGEGQSVEFDKVIPAPDDIAREYVAFANSDGGRLILGIDDKNKHLMGVTIEDNTIDKLMRIGMEKCVPVITPLIQVLDQAVEPDRKSKPKRVLIVIITVLAVACLSIVWAFAREAMERARQNPAQAQRLSLLRRYVRSI